MVVGPFLIIVPFLAYLALDPIVRIKQEYLEYRSESLSRQLSKCKTEGNVWDGIYLGYKYVDATCINIDKECTAYNDRILILRKWLKLTNRIDRIVQFYKVLIA